MPADHRHSRLLIVNWALMLTVLGLCGFIVWRGDPSATAGPRVDSSDGRQREDSSTEAFLFADDVADAARAGAAPQSMPRKSTKDVSIGDIAATEDQPSSQAGQAEIPPEAVASSHREIAEEEAATTVLFKAASPSVVHITTHRVGRDFFSLNLYKIPRGSGTGFVWDKSGHIVTNYHVIQDADAAYVAFGDQQTAAARLVGIAPDKDLAVLKVDSAPDRLRPLPLGTSSNLEVGLKALAIGNPFGLDQTLTMGIISALGREIESSTGLPIRDVIQTDAAINPGNSGGPLLDSAGNLIGVNTAIYSPSGAYAGIGFAIPVDIVKWVVPELIKHGKITRPGLAVSLASDRMIERFQLPGVLILDVNPRSRAGQAGLRPTRRTQFGEIVLGDIILAIDEASVRNNKDLLLHLEKYRVGDRVTLRVLRGGREVDVDVELETAE